MERTGIADLPLHRGRVPPWLFQRMARLGGAILEALLLEEGSEGALRRLSDPFWFQALGALLGMDWHSSGVTTTVLAALKQGFSSRAGAYGFFLCGGKGKHGLNTPTEIRTIAERVGVDGEELVRISRLTARVDTRLLQDGHDLYHHTLIFDGAGRWAVIQQGLAPDAGTARRYHWLGERVRHFCETPHTGIEGSPRSFVLDLTARESRENRKGILELFSLPLPSLLRELHHLPHLKLPGHHAIFLQDLDPRRLKSILLETYTHPPQGLEDLLLRTGIGPRTVRALSLLSELLYGAPPSFRDPARFAFAHGGKDGHPYPVDRPTYEDTLASLERALARARLGDRACFEALRRLSRGMSVPRSSLF